MLDVAKVIRRSNNKEFDTVVFFDRSGVDVLETQKGIPGARGYPGEFVDIVLLPDPEDAIARDEAENGINALSAPTDQPDTASTRQQQRLMARHREFIREFPFDIINLDLEGYAFLSGDTFPGKLIASLRKLLEWQKHPIRTGAHLREGLTGFSLMFTTKIGPPDLTQEYLDMLANAIQRNLERDGDLSVALAQRTGTADVAALRERSFESFFKIALPKLITTVLMDKDWCIDVETGIALYEIERTPPGQPSYKMLHIVMDVLRQSPPENQRVPGETHAPDAVREYETVARAIFEQEEIRVTFDIVDEHKLRNSLAMIRARRQKYYPEVEENTGD
ncbi:MAG: hypothetical protein ACRD5K_03140 [Candidatus Acidiferrales bacterium]